MIKALDLKKQYNSIATEIDEAIHDVIQNTAFVGGHYISEFERNFSAYVAAEHCIGVANGTDAIEIAIKALNLPQGSEIIVPANSFISTSEAVTTAGHKVVFCDVNDESANIDINELQQKITPNTKAIIAVHLWGLPSQIIKILEICNEHDLRLIEDCAQAHGARVNGQHVGTFGDVSTFSFYPGKNLGAFGDAGAVVTNNQLLADEVRLIANHGRKDKYNHQQEGRNSRLDGLQAAILSVKLKYLDKWIKKRQNIAEVYKRLLPAHMLLQKVPLNTDHAYHLFVIRTIKRDELKAFLEEKEVQVGIHYPIALPDLDAYAQLGIKGQCEAATKNANRILSLPIGDHLDISEVEQVCKFINQFGENYK
jgi:dTDP-4-amino-4,6-dideoxygalactose transaminase